MMMTRSASPLRGLFRRSIRRARIRSPPAFLQCGDLPGTDCVILDVAHARG